MAVKMNGKSPKLPAPNAPSALGAAGAWTRRIRGPTQPAAEGCAVMGWERVTINPGSDDSIRATDGAARHPWGYSQGANWPGQSAATGSPFGYGAGDVIRWSAPSLSFRRARH